MNHEEKTAVSNTSTLQELNESELNTVSGGMIWGPHDRRSNNVEDDSLSARAAIKARAEQGPDFSAGNF
jgi:bacteriocin-like protein